MQDMLKDIFERQNQLIEQYHEIEARNGEVVVYEADYGDIDSRTVQRRIKHLSQCTVEELMEAMNCLKNKPWKQTEVATDRMHYEEELADALHFFVEICITSGITADKLWRLYVGKHAVNEARQTEGY